MDETGYFKQSLQLGISDMVRHKTGHFRHGAARNWAFPKLGISESHRVTQNWVFPKLGITGNWVFQTNVDTKLDISDDCGHKTGYCSKLGIAANWVFQTSVDTKLGISGNWVFQQTGYFRRLWKTGYFRKLGISCDDSQSVNSVGTSTARRFL